jgi:hypothetical protein
MMSTTSKFTLAALILAVMPLFAQNGTKFEVAPFVGIETGASAPLNVPTDINGNPLSGISGAGVGAGVSYGTFVDYNKFEDLSFEFMWARNPTKLSQHDFTTGNSFNTYDATADQFTFGALFHLVDSTHKLRPFVAGGLGFTRTSNSSTPLPSAFSDPFFIPSSSTSDTAFIFNIGGGAKYYASKHFGFRGDLRFVPTYASSTQGVVCNGFGCGQGTQRNFYKRVNATAGVFFRF